MKTKIFTTCLCFTMLYFTAAAQGNQAAVPEEYFYYSKGKKTALTPASDEIFVTFATKVNLAKGSRYTTALKNQVEKPGKSDVFAPVNAIRYKVNPGQAKALNAVQGMLNEFKSNPDVITAYPAFKIGGEKVYVGNKIIYALKSGIQSAQTADFLKQHQSDIVEEINLGDKKLYVVAVSKGKSTFGVANGLYESGLVEYAEPDFTFSGKNDVIPNDPLYSSQWFLNQSNDADIDAPEAWDMSTGLSSVEVVVAVIDGNGYDLTHPDLEGKLVSSYDAVNDDNFPDPENADANHGTPCVGLIAASTNNSVGVAGVGFNIMALPICIGFNATGLSFSTNATIIARAAARVIATPGVVAVSNSYSFDAGSFATSVEASYASMRLDSRGGLGAVVLAATGNDNLSNPTPYPASYVNVIGVGASTSIDTRASFSNYGEVTDVVAPGVSTLTTDRAGLAGYAAGNYAGFDGTSAACPVAAGVVGLIASVNPNANWAFLMSYLLYSCDKVGGYTYSPGNSYGLWNNEMGYGRVNAFKGMQRALGPPVIFSFSPVGGPVGTSVTITGNKFLGTTAVTFNNVSASFTVVNASTIVATYPAGAGIGPIRVTNSGGTGTSTGVFTLSPYCVPAYNVPCSSGDYINNFSLHTLVNNGSGCNGQTGNYIHYIPSGNTTTQLSKGKSYTISMQSGPALAQGFAVWIDYNDDQDFNDTGEFVYGSPTAGKGVFTGNITIPSSVSVGLKRLRVRSYDAVIGAGQACTNIQWGETEDYTIAIITGYCVPFYSTSCLSGDYIENFSFNTLVNNNSECNGIISGYTNFTPAGALTTTVTKGKSYPLKVQSGRNAQGFGVWIDYNNDQDFNDTGEFVYSSPSSGTGLYTANITISANASTGQKRMRVRSKFNAVFSNAESCTEYSFGETEDYTITISDPVVSGSQWNKRFGGSSTDNFSVVVKTSDGGYLLAGHSQSGVSGDKTQAGQGNFDFWIVKTDASGNKQWDKRFGGSGADYLNSAIQTSDGGYLLGGNSISGISGDKSQASQGGKDYWVVKITSAGVKVWDKRFGGTGDEDLRSLIQTAGGSYFLAGYSNSAAGGDKSQGSQGNQDYWVVKITTAGAKLWDKRYGGSDNDFLEGVVQTSDGGYLLGGHSKSGISADKTQASRGGADYWVVRIDGNGSKQWDKRFGGSSDEILTCMGKTSGGYFYAGGYSISGVGGDKSQGSQGGKDYWLLKFTLDGAKLWDKRFGGAGDEELKSIMQTTDGGYIIGGRSLSGISGDKTQSSRGSSDYWAVRLDGNGLKKWDKRFGGSSAEELRTVLQTTDGGYLLGGRSDSGIGGDRSQPSQGGTDYWLVKLSAVGSTIASPEARLATQAQGEEGDEREQMSLRVSPNPFRDKLRVGFTLEKAGKVQVRVYDSQGIEVKSLFEGEAEAGKAYETEWQVSGEKAGLYMIRLATTDGVSHQKVILTK